MTLCFQVLLLAAAIAEVNMGQFGTHIPTMAISSVIGSGPEHLQIIPSLVQIAAQACRQRKGILREREHLRQCYQGLYLHCKEVLQMHGLLPPEKKISVPSAGSATGGLETLVGPLLSGMVQTVRPEDQLDIGDGPSSRRASFNAGELPDLVKKCFKLC